jgi:tripartite-type tricarboxylate transporter receptor subunit TctC
VRIIEPFGVGGGPDLAARAISPKLSELWGQPLTVENHPGKGSTEAPALVPKSPPRRLHVACEHQRSGVQRRARETLPYDPLKDFIPVAPLTNQPYVLVAGKSSGIASVGELIVAGKVKPGELKFGRQVGQRPDPAMI